VSAEQLLAQLAEVQAGNAPDGVATDALTAAILDRLNEEVARVYAEASAAGEGEGGSPAKSAGGGSRLDMTGSVAGGGGRPRPVDLWRASHEVDRAPKEKVVLTQGAWEDLVGRLNESSKKKELHLLKAQHKALADQLSGLTFTPQISDKSRELASLNKALPERVAALMRKKKAKLDKIRNEKVQRELSEATFKPNLTKSKGSAGAGVDAAVRKIGHLMQYEVDRRVRAEQRRALITEMEDRELTFEPRINKNSGRIVARLRQESEGAPSAGASVVGSPTSARISKKALVDTLVSGKQPLGRSYLPGHEQETFQPQINARSRALHRPATAGADVYSRLYVRGGGSKSPGGSVAEEEEGGAGRGVVGGVLDEDVGPRHPLHFNTVPFEAGGRHDFILRRLLSSAAAGTYE
jgi:hypothetical protein